MLTFLLIILENSAPGKELKPSGFQEYLEQTNKQTWNELENATDSYNLYGNNYDANLVMDTPNKEVSSLRYDFPYEPEKFDLSEADFAPSQTAGDGSYNGTLNYSPDTKLQNEPVKNNVDEVHVRNNNDYMQQMNGDSINGNLHVGDNSEVIFEDEKLPSVKTGSQSDTTQTLKALCGTSDPNIKIPVQAGTPPGPNLTLNGHSSEKMDSELVEKPVYQTQLSSIPSLSTINSSPEYDKYPVQCNTPQTPKDNPLVNPLDGQLSLNGGKIHPDSTKENNCLENYSENDPMQHIPKLQNLKDDLKMSSEIRGNSEQISSKMPLGKSTQSLPASLLNNSISADGNTCSSLPSELVTNVESANKKMNLYEADLAVNKLKENSVAFEAKHENEKCGDTNSGDQKLLVNDIEREVNGFTDKVVGFGNADVEIDDADLDDYLKSDAKDEPHYSVQEPRFEKALSSTDTVVSNAESAEQSNNISAKHDVSAMDTSNSIASQIFNCSDNDHKSNVEHNINDIDTDSHGLNNATNTTTGLNVTEDTTLEVFKVLPSDPSQLKSKSVATDLAGNLSPVATMSLDSGCASMGDNFDETIHHSQDNSDSFPDTGARPKDYQNKVNRPSSLVGLSKVNYDSESPFVLRQTVSPSVENGDETASMTQDLNQSTEKLIVNASAGITIESRQLMDGCNTVDQYGVDTNENDSESMTQHENEADSVELRHPDRFQPSEGVVSGRPRSWSPSDTGQPQVQKQKRPTSLNLPPPPTINPSDRPVTGDPSPETDAGTEIRGDSTEQDNTITGKVKVI